MFEKQGKKLSDVALCLQRLRSIRAYSGDVFFHSLAKTFISHSVVPFDHDPFEPVESC
jgi:hypothetical protein